ncbi:carbohydrate-binding module family 5 protein [Hydnum rufescens UP504]|uniref:Carbohydrate-binding module family 5 protein n=1 Tax=Hydnum rufescens UP504 TaxID=1448309 RepID=A0A9P6DQQ9_9AGAM|nr:carbohydrate-binding module family 5 protein [Hydnum rufescens UP504]
MHFTVLSLLAAAITFIPSIVYGSPISRRAGAQNAPHFVIYHDDWTSGETGPPTPAKLAGYNVYILSFLLLSGPADQAATWAGLDAATRTSSKDAYSAAGIKLMVSAFGSTDMPVTSGADPAATANTMAAWVKRYDLDGIDVDFEDFAAVNAADGSAEKWLITFTRTLRNSLPTGQYIITHAPVAPWFSPIYTAGAYTKVNAQVGDLIDWYNLQYYNQDEYTTCHGILTASSSAFPKTAVFEIHATAGVPLDKLVIGKPGTPGDATNGWVDPHTLARCVSQAQAQGWNAGTMVWQFPSVSSAWISAVRSQAWPIGGGGGGGGGGGSGSGGGEPSPPPPASSTTSSSATSTTTSSADPSQSWGSTTVGAWLVGTVYVGGQQVTYNGVLYQAKWWTLGEIPGIADVWKQVLRC